MKRFFSVIAMVAVLAVAVFSFSSCEKITKPKHLAGTTWTGTSSYGLSYNFNFTSESTVTYTGNGNGLSYSATGTFTFSNPSITISAVLPNGYTEMWTGTVNESVMNLMYDGETVVLTRIGK